MEIVIERKAQVRWWKGDAGTLKTLLEVVEGDLSVWISSGQVSAGNKSMLYCQDHVIGLSCMGFMNEL